jgi:5,10-methylene-tetrahydrofolate dehydrogenase/methenyl tetrahydrofolate cyclohydrolase
MEMPKKKKYSWGETTKSRAKLLLEKLLALDEPKRQKVKCRWNGEKKVECEQSGQEVTYYRFVVETSSEDLLHFINDCSDETSWNRDNLRQAIGQIEETIMGKKKNRKGKHTWEIELHLWFDRFNNKQNVDRFCQEWDEKSPTTGSGVEQATLKTNDKQSIHDELIELLNTELAQNNDLSIKIIKFLQKYFAAKIENRPKNTSFTEADHRNNNLLSEVMESVSYTHLTLPTNGW